MGNKQSEFQNITDQQSLILVVKGKREIVENELDNQIIEAKKDLLTALSDPNSINEIKMKMKLREEKIILRSVIEGMKKAEDYLAKIQYSDIPTLAKKFERLFLLSEGSSEEVQLKASLIDLENYLDIYKRNNTYIDIK
jgi:hypothetical protein